MIAELWAVGDDLALLFGFSSLIVEIDTRLVFNASCKKHACPSGTSAGPFAAVPLSDVQFR